MKSPFLKQLRQDIGALWILLLVLLAGMLNAAAFLLFGRTVSHMTGNLSMLGLAIGEGRFDLALMFALFILAFFVGATLSGFGFPQHNTGLWLRSGKVLLVCGLVLLVSQWLTVSDTMHLAALALVLGAQNGLTLRYRGILTRTTHMTGHLTDCGAALGRMMHKRVWQGEDLRLFLFHLSCLLSFLLGLVLAALLNGVLEAEGLNLVQLAALLYLLTGALTYLRGFGWRRATQYRKMD